MATVVRWIARLTPRVLLLGLVTASAPLAPARITPAGREPSTTMVAHAYYPEVRLRKLHLVRPDLIPYPIEYEVYC